MDDNSNYSPLKERIAQLEHRLEASQISEAVLRAEKAFLRTVLDRLPVGIALLQRGIMLWHNEALTRMLGYGPEELSGKNARMIYPDEEEYDRVRRALQELDEKNDSIELETKWLAKNGSVLDCRIRYIIFEPHPESPLILSVAQDITEKTRLSSEVNRLAEAIYHTSEAIVITDKSGNITYINPAFSKITGYSWEEAIGHNPRILKSGKHSDDFYKNLWDTISSGVTWRGRLTNKKKDGTLYTEDATISPVFSSKGEIIAYVAVKRDITEILKLETELYEAQKLELIGLLAGGIAHDFNNILQSIYGYTQLLLMDGSFDESDTEKLRNIEKATQRAIDLVSQILTFSRKSEPKMRPIDLNQEIRLTSRLLKRTIPKMISLEFHLDKELAPINADPVQIQQIIINLSTNARDAMPDGGKLVFRTKNVILDNSHCKSHPDVREGRYVLLEVADTGHGIGEKDLSRIFDPFFTTKEPGKGTGLGLSVVYGIVRQHNGLIKCSSQPGAGTKFQIYLAAIKEDIGHISEPETAIRKDDLPRGRETILLVDDEPSVLDIGSYILRRAGYKVIKALSCDDALDMFRKNKRRISLVLLDLIMPGMGGKQCLEQLLKIDSNVRVIIASGLSVDLSPKELIKKGVKAFLQKPYQMDQLLKTVRKVLDNN